MDTSGGSGSSHGGSGEHAWEGLGEGRLFGGDTLEGGSGGGRHGGFGRIYTAAMADPSEVSSGKAYKFCAKNTTRCIYYRHMHWHRSMRNS
ncbi:hypothetical protein SORBI_3010G054700 [Sorghum bicolor]|uniref:Uncharacterized protein n=1 Tax=Sorghum bicolor TaxID=4558 RepID=A0A194YHG7_SORBI|nr:hypothetical protein SORBI_3010G054700 [Sorghum bicolor]